MNPKKRLSISPLQVFVSFLILFFAIQFSTYSFAQTETEEAKFIPWSGFWWPTNGGGLANGYDHFGHPSPLEKYEMYTKGSYPGAATQWELENFFDVEAPGWFGRCNAWAAAAAYENIEFFPSSINNIVFRVGDKKGLITSCHGDDPAVRIAIGNDPSIFHEWLLRYIKEQGVSFAADMGSSGEVWFYPIYKYEMNLNQSGSTIQVGCRIWYADDQVHPDIQETVSVTRYFTYSLTTNSNGEIVDAEWTGNSIYNHPKNLVFPLSPGPDNPNLDYDIVKDIAEHRDDDIENNNPVTLPPGTHNLILLNRDIYILPCKKGDIFRLALHRLDNLDNTITVRLVDASGFDVFKQNLENSLTLGPMTADFSLYRLIFDSDEYSRGNIYQVVFDINREGEDVFPDILKTGGWNGFAVTNTGNEICRKVMVVAYNQFQEPIATLLGPEDLGPKKKSSFLLSSLPIKKHEAKEIYSIKIFAEGKPSVLFLNGISEMNMVGFGYKSKASSKIVLPDTTTMYNTKKHISMSLYNPSSNAEPLYMSLYDQNGTLKKSANIEISPFNVRRFSAASNPFNMQVENGWISVDSSENSVGGYLNWRKDGSGGADTIFALSKFENTLYIPHIATTGSWETNVTMINLSDAEPNEVNLLFVHPSSSAYKTVMMNPREKRTIDVAALFDSIDKSTLSEGSIVINSMVDLSGFFKYMNNSSSVSFELMRLADANKALAIPHIASDKDWWTGVAFFNYLDKEETISLLPYDHSGNLLSNHIKTITIPSIEKRIYLIKSLYNHLVAGQIAWIEVKTKSGGILGLFICGDNQIKAMAGSVMYPIE